MVAQAAMKSTMFTDSMLDVSWAQRSRRSLMTLTSFGLQAVVLSLLLLIPLLKTIVLPEVRTVSTPLSLGRREVQPLVGRPHVGSVDAPTNPHAIPFVQPGSIPRTIPVGDDSTTQAPVDPMACVNCIGTSGVPDGVRGLFGDGDHAVTPAPPRPEPVPARVFRTSSILQGMLIHQVQPVYPQIARTARIQGEVVIAAVISKAGTMSDLHVLHGPPMLVTAAMEAVKQWRYKPYILNDQPIEVETQITVNFTLAGN